MTATADMPTPVTRGELREELEQLETRIDDKLGQLETRFDDKLGQLETRFDDKLGQLETRFDDKLGQLETRFDHKLDLWGGALLARIESGEQRMIAELGRHAKAIQEALSMQLSVMDEKYADLPARVSHLESVVLRRPR